MQVTIHFLNGNDLSMENHYAQKEYRDDVVVEIDKIFYEVYFFVESILEYEMRKDGFFSFPGIIILDEISNKKIFNAIDQLINLKFFDNFIGNLEIPLNKRFIDKWYLNRIDYKSTENIFSYKLR